MLIAPGAQNQRIEASNGFLDKPLETTLTAKWFAYQRILHKIPKNKIPIEQNPEWKISRIGQNPELDKIPNWSTSQIDKIQNRTNFKDKVKISVPSKLCACARAHSFQRLRTRINLLRTDMLLSRHIVAHGLLHKYYKNYSFQKKSAHTKIFAHTDYKKLEGTLVRINSVLITAL